MCIFNDGYQGCNLKGVGVVQANEVLMHVLLDVPLPIETLSLLSLVGRVRCLVIATNTAL